MIHQKYELSSDSLDLCKGKLVPGIVATWGEIVGDIENQADLVEYVNSHGGGGNAEWGSITGTITDQEDLMTLLDDYATQEWVEGKGYLVSADLSQYATRQWVTGRGYITSDALDGYATETWVGQQGYITSAALSGYATEQWVGQQGYIDQIKTVNNQSLVGEGNIEISGLTQEQEDAVDMLINHEGGVLYTRELLPYTTSRYTVGVGDSSFQRFMFNLGGDIYCIGSQNLFKWNEIDFNFDRLFTLSSFNWQPLWMDATGRVYMGYGYEVNMTTGQVDSIDLGDVASYYYHYGDNMHNIFTGKNGIYLVNYEKAFKFNETNQEFDEITLSNPDSLDLGYIISLKLVEYEGHLVMVFDGRMYEFNEYDDRVEVVEVQQPYFPLLNFNNDNIDSQYFHKIGSDYLYLKEYIHSKLDNGQWTHIEIKDPDGISIQYYWGPGVNQGEYLMGYNNASTYDVLVTVAGDGYDSMNWTKVSSLAVDLTSMQTVKGAKTFESTINARGGLQITNVNAYSNDTVLLLAKNRTEAASMSFLVPGLFTLNGVDIATTQDCIMNRETLYTGPRFTGVCSYPYGYNRENFWTTPAGRLFSTESWGLNTYEFDGDEFTQIYPSTAIPGNVRKVVTSGGDLYGCYNGWLYKWDDANATWQTVCECQYDDLWTVGSTIRQGSDNKLVNDEWVSDPVQDYKGPYSELVGGYVYVHADNKIYRYEESNKTYTELGSYTDWGTNNWFVFEDELYYTGADNVVYKIDFSRVGSGNDLNVPTDIVCNEYAQFYGKYGDYLYTAMNNGMFGYTYDVNETVPEPDTSTDTTYVLKATVQDGEVTYEWVPEV